MSVDYKATVFLPATSFAMRGELPKREPGLLARWQEIGLWGKLRGSAKGRKKFVLHDGPPYANGHLHIGHALNKILKDVVNRVHQMNGEDAVYVPGWDCHGLPIEWMIEEQYRAKGKDKDAVPIAEFRRECRQFADQWLDVQRTEFKRLGVEGDWEQPYTTMSFEAEAQIAREIGKFAMNGLLYRGARPVMWSVVEKTALAEAEIEYHDHKSTTVHARFPVVRPSNPALAGASILIWTTTPWTIPANRALAVGEAFEYGVYTVDAVAEGSLAQVGEKLVFATALEAALKKDAKITALTRTATLGGTALVGTVCDHPLKPAHEFYGRPVPVFAGDFVTTEAGTGVVHIAPSHGEDDFNLGRKHGIPAEEYVADDGSYVPRVALFAGKRIYTPEGKAGDANGAVIKALSGAGGLLAKGSLVHSYPHSWRSKAPLIFRNTPQWFIAMDDAGTGNATLRERSLRAIDQTAFYPPSGRNRLRGMIEARPDWCISRQRAWGVPIAVFVHRDGPEAGQPLRDAEVMERIAQAFEAEGADAWYASRPERFLGAKYRPEDFEQVTDIVDVWFDSGSTHSFVLEKRADLQWPASLYLEGSDQHRGWFHSSLLESCGTRDRAPYEGVLTHGFVLDENGRKMSKSLGNVTAPQQVINQYGADILRLWVVSSDYSEDLRIGPEILKQQAEYYRRLRNTLRYLLGNLAGFGDSERVAHRDLPELERFVLHRLAELDGQLRDAIASNAFTGFYTALHNFCATDLSAFYFDIRKDALYCDAPDAPRRRACRTVLAQLFECLTAWLAPVLCFTAEEAFLARLSDQGIAHGTQSVHLRQFPAVPAEWRDAALGERWAAIRAARSVVTGALELARAAKKIGASLQAAPVVFVDATHAQALRGVDVDEVFITSGARVEPLGQDTGHVETFALPDVAGVAVAFNAAEGAKCERCWRVLPEVGSHKTHPKLCLRCADVVDGSPQQAAAQ